MSNALIDNYIARLPEGLDAARPLYRFDGDRVAGLFYACHLTSVFQPVCTTELGDTAKLAEQFRKRNVKVLALSVDAAGSHKKWISVIDSLQLTDGYSVATPVNWKDGEDVIIVPSLQDPEVLKQKFPKGYKAIRPYLRVTPQPNK